MWWHVSTSTPCRRVKPLAKLSQQIPLVSMSDNDNRGYRTAKTCVNCNCYFTHRNYKVRHHCHVTWKYLFPACNNCNLQLKPKECQSNTYFLPCLFHDLKNYDGHIVIKHFQKQCTKKVTRMVKMSPMMMSRSYRKMESGFFSSKSVT